MLLWIRRWREARRRRKREAKGRTALVGLLNEREQNIQDVIVDLGTFYHNVLLQALDTPVQSTGEAELGRPGQHTPTKQERDTHVVDEPQHQPQQAWTITSEVLLLDGCIDCHHA